MTELMQPTRVVDDIRTFFDTTQADPRAMRSVLPAAIRLLAEGRPVSPEEIGAAANLPLARADRSWRPRRRRVDLERTGRGHGVDPA